MKALVLKPSVKPEPFPFGFKTEAVKDGGRFSQVSVLGLYFELYLASEPFAVYKILVGNDCSHNFQFTCFSLSYVILCISIVILL